MNPTEHPLHSKTEIRIQWIAIACMAIGLLTSIYYHGQLLRAERIKSELSSYLHLNDRYHHLLFALIQNDSEVFQKEDEASLKSNKYIMYELFELLASVQSIEKYFKELDKDVWPCWQQRTEFLFSKPAIRYAWQSHLRYAGKIYKPEFIEQIENVIAQEPYLLPSNIR